MRLNRWIGLLLEILSAKLYTMAMEDELQRTGKACCGE